jgi:low affinity Fe/Cu permease
MTLYDVHMPKDFPEELIEPSPKKFFANFAKLVAGAAGHPTGFLIALALIATWASTGHLFDYSNTWQLIVNTGTTIVTFLMVFLIQNTQNRDSAAMQIKLDELIRTNKDAHDALLDLEELTEKELEMIRKKYEVLAAEARAALRKGKKDNGKIKKLR